MTTSLGREVRETFEAAGIGTDGAHILQFYLYFPTEDAATVAARGLTGEGWEHDVRESVTGEGWMCFSRRRIPIDEDVLDGLGVEIAEICKTHDGELDGWDLDPTGTGSQDPDTLMRHAVGLYQQGNLLRASELLRRVAESGSEHAGGAWSLIGMACFRLRLYPQSAGAFSHALDLDPRDADALAGKASALSAAGQHTEAVEYYEKALAVRPEMAETHLNFAACLANLGRGADAVDALREAVSRDERIRARARKMKALRSLKGEPGFDEAMGRKGGLLGWLRR